MIEEYKMIINQKIAFFTSIIKILLISIILLFNLPVFASKAVCIVKNMQTGQIYEAIKGRLSYSVAKKESIKEAAINCINNAKIAKYCQLRTCYQR